MADSGIKRSLYTFSTNTHTQLLDGVFRRLGCKIMSIHCLIVNELKHQVNAE